MKLYLVPKAIPISTFSPNFSILIQGLSTTHFCSPKKEEEKIRKTLQNLNGRYVDHVIFRLFSSPSKQEMLLFGYPSWKFSKEIHNTTQLPTCLDGFKVLRTLYSFAGNFQTDSYCFHSNSYCKSGFQFRGFDSIELLRWKHVRVLPRGRWTTSFQPL